MKRDGRALQNGGRATAPFRARPGVGLSLYALGAHRPALPPFAELFGLCRAGHHALRAVGGRMDGARPHPALPPFWQPWPRFRAAKRAARRALVPALALRTLAGDERKSAARHLMEPDAAGRYALPHRANAFRIGP